MKKLIFLLSTSLGIFLVYGLVSPGKTNARASFISDWTTHYTPTRSEATRSSFHSRLANAALERTRYSIRYDPAYVQIAYPGGDVPADTGVCTDVVIRSYRALGIDLQKEIHEDMMDSFSDYPNLWGLPNPDANIDHRRVPNLMVFFSKFGNALPLTSNPNDYKPGDIVAWDFGGGRTHIGIVSPNLSRDGYRYKVVHNAGWGPKDEDKLFDWKIIGHFRFEPSESRIESELAEDYSKFI